MLQADNRSLSRLRWNRLRGKTFEYEGFRVPVHLAGKTGAGPETFKQIADHHQAALRKWIGLSAPDRVLEVGCGIGRDAISLLQYLVEGSYIGVDIFKPSIRWCSRSILGLAHMFCHEIEHYLGKFARILVPGGRFYATTFIYDDDVLMSARRTNLTPWNLRFEHEIEPGTRINSLRSPRRAVAYTGRPDGKDVALLIKPV